jgi:hypothetical protein
MRNAGVIEVESKDAYNLNNVAFEGSTATTVLELLVGDDLCRMMGYQIPAAADERLRRAGKPAGVLA